MSISPIAPVGAAPIIDNVNPARLQVMAEEIPERLPCVFAKMGCVINNDVEPLRGYFSGYAVKYFWILLETLVHVYAARIVVDWNSVEVQTRDPPTREQITPQIHRTPPLDAELQ